MGDGGQGNCFLLSPITYHLSSPLVSASRFQVSPEQVEQGEEEYPDDVYEVPVETGQFNGRVIFRRVASLPREEDQIGEDADADNHVERVQPRHRKINPVEHLHLVRVASAFPVK